MKQKYYYMRNSFTGEKKRVWFEKTIATIRVGKTITEILNLELWCNEGPYTPVTVDIGIPCGKDRAFVDTSNTRGIMQWLIKRGIAYWTGFSHWNGYCEYPEMKFNADFLASLDGDA